MTIPGSSNVKTPTTPSLPSLTAHGLLAIALTLLGALLAPPRSLAAIGDLTYMDCIANLGANGCEQAANDSLRQAHAVAVSRDGNAVYVGSSDAITWFKRHSDGTLTYKGCIEQTARHGCLKARHGSLEDVSDIAISRDGKSVYAAAVSSKSITRFGRHSNGALTYKGCFANSGANGCKKPRHNSLGGPSGLTVSRDGRSVYVASYRPSGGPLTRFRRRPNGALRYGGCFASEGQRGCQTPTHNSLYFSYDVEVSPDGGEVYVGSRNGITTFKRGANGALAYGGCLADGGRQGCQMATHSSLQGSRDLAISPDGNSLYVASFDSITRFQRAADGALTYDDCMANGGAHGCQAPVHDSLRSPNDLAVSRDGESVYVASGWDNSITAFGRAFDGTLTYGECFANQGALGCEAPSHDSLGYASGVAVSRDGRSVYVAAGRTSHAITTFSRETSGP